MALLSGRQITRNAGRYTENFSGQVWWHHSSLPQCGLLWSWGTCSMDEYWHTHTHKTMRGLGFLWQWPLKITYSVMWRLTVWQILTDVLENTTAPTCEVIKIPRKDTGTWWKNTDLGVFGSLVSSSHPNPPVLSQSYVPTPNRYYTIRHQAGRQRMQLNGSIPAIEHFNFNWPNGPPTSR